MRTVNSIDIDAPMSTVFRLSSDIERWPDILPHYRWVTFFSSAQDISVVEMAARRGIIPVKWTSIQRPVESEGLIIYKHIGGFTKGMWVEWVFEQIDAGTRVTIIHDLDLVRKIVSSRIGKWVVGEIFVKNIADKTLKHIKAVAEGNADGL